MFSLIMCSLLFSVVVMRVRVEPLSHQDIGRVVEVVESLPEWFTAGAVEEVVRDAKRMPGFVARVDGVVRGFILLDERECCIEIAWLAVEKEYQGRGIGTALVEAAEGYACRRGKRVLTVKTYGGMDYEPYNMTMGFYRGRGFRLYEVIRNYEPFGEQPAAILIKHLDCAEGPQP